MSLQKEIWALLTRPIIERYIRFGPFQVGQQLQEVTKGGSRLKLQGIVYEVLLALLES
jgi:DNA-binding winged helix-turn-helix (wHTH) protein